MHRQPSPARTGTTGGAARTRDIPNARCNDRIMLELMRNRRILTDMRKRPARPAIAALALMLAAAPLRAH